MPRQWEIAQKLLYLGKRGGFEEFVAMTRRRMIPTDLIIHRCRRRPAQDVATIENAILISFVEEPKRKQGCIQGGIHSSIIHVLLGRSEGAI